MNPLAGVACGTMAVVVGAGVEAVVVAPEEGSGAASRLSECSCGSSWSGSWDSVVVSSVVGSVLPAPLGPSVGSTNDGVGVLPTPLVCQGVDVT